MNEHTRATDEPMPGGGYFVTMQDIWNSLQGLNKSVTVLIERDKTRGEIGQDMEARMRSMERKVLGWGSLSGGIVGAIVSAIMKGQ